jgi:drug/metabolite transporter (DMT)-like permease
MSVVSNFSGEIAALLAAFLWAFSSVLFKDLGKSIKPVELNLLKGVGAIFLLALTSLLLKEAITSLSFLTIIMLIISGVIGIGFGDTMYFEAINSIGPRRTLLITILAPLITAVLAYVFLDEQIAGYAWLGVMVTALGIAWVVTRKRGEDGEAQAATRKGILFAFLAALSQATGAVISRWALTQTSISALQSAVIRLFAGIIFLLIWVGIRHLKLGEWMKSGSSFAASWGRVILVVVLGAYLPLWLQQVAFKNTQVGIAQTLLATSPLFILPITALRKEKITLREILGVIISVTGIAILFLVR